MRFSDYIEFARSSLDRLVVTKSGLAAIDRDEGLDLWCRWSLECRDAGGQIYFAGNGASAMMASHMAADATKNGRLPAQAFNDAALMTAVANDISYDEVFAFPLKSFGRKGDLLVTISSSGNSKNVIRAIETAKEMGIAVVTISGMRDDNTSRRMGDLNFYLPAPTYGLVESSHQLLLHYWLDKIMNDFPR